MYVKEQIFTELYYVPGFRPGTRDTMGVNSQVYS